MDTNTVGFNLNRIYSLRNKSGDSFSVSAFNGSISFTVFKPDDRAPSIKIGISLALSIEIVKQLKKPRNCSSLLDLSCEKNKPCLLKPPLIQFSITCSHMHFFSIVLLSIKT